MEYIVFLRGVTPKGRNSIPKMAYLVDILLEVGFKNVRTYIQSGNIILDTNLDLWEINKLISETIREKIGANLKIIIKTKDELKNIVENNPFGNDYTYSRIHVVLCQDEINKLPIEKIEESYGEEEIVFGSDCIYLYLPKSAIKKKLNTNFLERIFGVDMTMRKINVVNNLLMK